MKQKQSRRIGQRRILRRNKQIAAQADAQVKYLDLVVGAAEDTLTEHELQIQDLTSTISDLDSRVSDLESP